ncbi:hypothetical protein BO71DRAFT_475811 [Aspergillus ellipticus CBS 707.79]|uniref:HNH nuclease domain-containing protein n=1 Tax=Aspergillus ellipticus CBS 707.79 TaxID=1448320 RepID=A0A319DAW7_9EURO|nr:hypothetical protein BO71DRAFT_475811 [Aspergillus ellipticus CBS 707.79]
MRHHRWLALNAVHIYPVARLNDWNQLGYSRWITGTTAPALIAPNGIFLPQNGLLLDSTTHAMFDAYDIAVSPDHGRQVVVFSPDSRQLRGRVLSSTTRPRAARDQNMAVSDNLLRWHFHQAILLNIRGGARECGTLTMQEATP